MPDDLTRLIDSIEGEGPSREFVETLRERIVAETQDRAADLGGSSGTIVRTPHDPGAAPIEGPDDEIVVVFDRESAPLARRRDRRFGEHRHRFLAAAAAAAIVAIGGIWALTADDDGDRDQLDTVDIPTTTRAPDGAVGIGDPLTAGNTFFDAGTFRIDTLGTEFTFSVDETRGLLLNENDIVLITHLTSRNADDRTISLRRTTMLPDPTAPTGDFDRSTAWPATDLAGWLERLTTEVTASAPASTTLGGRAADFVELEFPCNGGVCAANLPVDTPELPMFTPGSHYRLWVVDQGQEDPIVVVVAIDDEDEREWFDEADDILATLAFGEIAPNPVRRVAAGALELDVFAGISLEPPDEVVVVEPFEGFARIFPPGVGVRDQQLPGLGWRGDVEFLTRPLDTSGVEVTTIERLVTLLEDEAAAVTELDPVDIGGVEARTFDVDSGGIPNVVLKVRADDLVRSEFGWESPRIGSLWAIEHPDRGLLLVSAENRQGAFEIEPLRQWTDSLLRTLRFEEA